MSMNEGSRRFSRRRLGEITGAAGAALFLAACGRRDRAVLITPSSHPRYLKEFGLDSEKVSTAPDFVQFFDKVFERFEEAGIVQDDPQNPAASVPRRVVSFNASARAAGVDVRHLKYDLIKEKTNMGETRILSITEEWWDKGEIIERDYTFFRDGVHTTRLKNSKTLDHTFDKTWVDIAKSMEESYEDFTKRWNRALFIKNRR